MRMLKLAVTFLSVLFVLSSVSIAAANIPEDNFNIIYGKVGDTITIDDRYYLNLYRTLGYDKEYIEYIGHSTSGRLQFKLLKPGKTTITISKYFFPFDLFNVYYNIKIQGN